MWPLDPELSHGLPGEHFLLWIHSTIPRHFLAVLVRVTLALLLLVPTVR
jgi:hypothetical protein